MRKKYAVAVCQMDSQKDKQENLRIAGEMIAENAAKGAKIIAFPETMNYMGSRSAASGGANSRPYHRISVRGGGETSCVAGQRQFPGTE